MWKVCGMREGANIEEVLGMNPDFLGLIFYERSKRFVSDLPAETITTLRVSDTKIVGVFVNEGESAILEKVQRYSLDYVQLHGDESPELGASLKGAGVGLIKVFRIEAELPVQEMEKWEPLVDYFLFDTQTSQYGGSGVHFDWGVLRDYNGTKPFLLSGGIQLEDLPDIQNLELPKMVGIDVNSRFETAPGLKDIEKVKELKEEIC